MRVLYNNIVSASTINATSEAVGYEASASLKDTRLARKWRSTSTAYEVVFFAPPSDGCLASHCVVAAHNLTSSAVVQLQGSNNGSSYSVIATVSPVRALNYLYDESGDYLADETGDACQTSDYPNPTVISRDTRIASFSTVCYKYYAVVIHDTENPAGYIEIGHVYIGESLALPGMSPDMEIPTTSTADVSSSLAGQRYGDSRVRLKTASIKAPAITTDQKIDIETWFDTVDIIDPFWLLVWESDLWAEMPIYCALTKDLKWKKDAVGTSWTLDFDFLEVR